MLPITGYADRWSVRSGDAINFMIAVKAGGRYSARIARVICGDPNPKGPGYREIPVKWDLEGQHDGIEQSIAKGSWVDVSALALPAGPIAFAATVWPTLLAAGRQAVLNWAGAGGAPSVFVARSSRLRRSAQGKAQSTISTARSNGRASPMAATALMMSSPRKALEPRPRPSPNGIFPSAFRPTLRPISVRPGRTAFASICRRAR